MNKISIGGTLVIISIIFAACTGTKNVAKQPTIKKFNPVVNSNSYFKNLDLSVSPKNDFFRFVNGKWLESVEIPADQGTWGSFNELVDRNDSITLNVVKSAMKSGKYPKGTDQYKAGVLFNTFLDFDNRNKLGIQPLKPILNKINAIQNVDQLVDFLQSEEQYGGAGLFGFGPGPDLKNSSITVAWVAPGSLGLSRDYYVDENKKELLAKYEKHVARMLGFLGDNDKVATEKAARILALEKKMAVVRFTKEESRNPELSYNPMTMDELAKITPSVNWKKYFTAFGVENQKTYMVSQPKYMATLEDILKNTPLSEIKEYLTWTLIDGNAGAFSQEIDNANFDFYGKTLRGLEQQRPDEKRALGTVNGSVGFAVGKLYVDQVFPEAAKTRVKDMVVSIIEEYKSRINKLTWMSPETKVQAIGKLDALTIKVGYPDKWKEYSSLDVKSYDEGGSLFSNRRSVRAWNFQDDLSKLGDPVDKTEWGMTPQRVNAYYNPLFNEIVFPAAILQPPFFDFKADDAVVYGAIGAVIGHEISHGFDDQGARFDKEGNMTNWWTEQDLTAFQGMGKALSAHYDAYEPIPDVHVNGTFTLGENIGDLGGVNVAYSALMKHLAKNGNPGLIDGLTQEQRFFMSWGTVWRTKMRDEALKQKIATDPHSPGMVRAVAPLVLMDEFYQAFDIKMGDKMYVAPEKRVKIW